MIRRLFVLAGIALVAACASTPQSADAADPREKDPKFRYGSNPGPSPVGAIPDALLNDATRQRSVKITIDYPTRGGPHPVIVFSHGGGGSNRGYPGLASHWASYGYVVIRPSHIDTAKAEEMTVAEWRDRVRDVTVVIDALASLPETYPELQGKIDATRVAVAGHSRGAMTAMMIGGLRTFPGPVSYADLRVKAIAVLSPSGPREMWGVTSESFAEIKVPALFMTGSLDTGATETETPQWRQQAFELSPAGDKWLVTMEGVGHMTFTGQSAAMAHDQIMAREPVRMDPRVDPNTARAVSQQQQRDRARLVGADQRALFSQIRALALAFFDAYLKDDPKGREQLEKTDARETVEVKKK